MRVLACVLAAAAIVACTPGGAGAHALCPGIDGRIAYPKQGVMHVVSLRDCAERVAGKAVQGVRFRPIRSVRTTGRGAAVQRIWVHGRLVFAQRENGPVLALTLSPDGRWLVFAVDSFGSASILADGLDLLVVSTRGGAVHHLGVTLVYPDYLSWCGGRLVFAQGADRIASHGKRLLVASPPAWRTRPLWDDRALSFASPSCDPAGNAVAVLVQRSSANAHFFATRWRLWRVGLDGTRRALDVPPPGFADEEPTWSPEGGSLAFVRERSGYGRIMLLQGRRLFGPLAELGYALGYYGHHDWGIAWRT